MTSLGALGDTPASIRMPEFCFLLRWRGAWDMPRAAQWWPLTGKASSPTAEPPKWPILLRAVKLQTTCCLDGTPNPCQRYGVCLSQMRGHSRSVLGCSDQQPINRLQVIHTCWPEASPSPSSSPGRGASESELNPASSSLLISFRDCTAPLLTPKGMALPPVCRQGMNRLQPGQEHLRQEDTWQVMRTPSLCSGLGADSTHLWSERRPTPLALCLYPTLNDGVQSGPRTVFLTVKNDVCRGELEQL